MSLRRIKIIKNKIERKIYHYRFLKKIDVHDTIFMVMKHPVRQNGKSLTVLNQISMLILVTI